MSKYSNELVLLYELAKYWLVLSIHVLVVCMRLRAVSFSMTWCIGCMHVPQSSQFLHDMMS